VRAAVANFDARQSRSHARRGMDKRCCKIVNGPDVGRSFPRVEAYAADETLDGVAREFYFYPDGRYMLVRLDIDGFRRLERVEEVMGAHRCSAAPLQCS
jgi:hypothetical protein